MKRLTVVRFPDGSWSWGGQPSDSDYKACEVYLMPFTGESEAKKQAQAVRRRLVAKSLPLPSQVSPYLHPWVAT